LLQLKGLDSEGEGFEPPVGVEPTPVFKTPVPRSQVELRTLLRQTSSSLEGSQEGWGTQRHPMGQL